MQDSTDKQTIDLFQPVKRGRGRPVTGNAATAAERAKRYRDNKRALRQVITDAKTELTSRDSVTLKDAAFDAASNRVAQLELENARLLAELKKWQGIVEQRDRDYDRDLKWVIADKDRKIAAQRGQATRYRNEANDLRERLASTQRQLSQELAKHLLV